MPTSEEIWRPVHGWETLYEVSNHGRVRSFPRVGTRSDGRRYVVKGRILRPGHSFKDRPHVMLCLDGVQCTRTIQILVAEAFICPRPHRKMVVRHLNDIPSDNRPENLAWGTQSENLYDASRNGLMPRGESHGHAKATEAQVREIRTRLLRGERQFEIRRDLGLPQGLVSDIALNKTWRHVTVAGWELSIPAEGGCGRSLADV